MVFLRDFYRNETVVFHFDLTTKKLTNLFQWDYQLYWIEYSRDSSSLYFNNDPKSILKFSIADRSMQTILRHDKEVYALRPIPNSNKLSMIERQVIRNLWQVDLSMQSVTQPIAPKRITEQSVNIYPQFANHTDKIAFISLRTGQPELFVKQGDEPERQMTNLPYWLKHETLNWSPDDKKLLTVIRNGIYSINMQTGVVTQHTPSASTSNPERLIATSVSWSADGEWIYFSSDKSGAWQIWKIPSSGKTERHNEFGIQTDHVIDAIEKMRPVTTRGGLYAKESADGQYLYYSKFQKTGLWRIDLSLKSSEEELVAENLELSSGRSWILGKQGVYYYTQVNSIDEIRYFSFNSNEEKVITRPPNLRSRYFTINKDETKMIISQLDQFESNLRLITEVKSSIHY